MSFGLVCIPRLPCSSGKIAGQERLGELQTHSHRETASAVPFSDIALSRAAWQSEPRAEQRFGASRSSRADNSMNTRPLRRLVSCR